MKLTPDNFEATFYTLHEYNVNYTTRDIYLGGIVNNCENEYEIGVGPEMALQFIRNITALQQASDEPILVHMCSVGGDWSYGMAMYDAIKNCPCYVTVLAYAHARSMSSLIPQAADLRVNMPNAFFMLHEGELGFDGTQKGAHSFVEQAKKDMEVMLDVYIAGGCVPKREEIRARMDKKQEWYLTAKEAVELGFMDEVFDGNWENLRA